MAPSSAAVPQSSVVNISGPPRKSRKRFSASRWIVLSAILLISIFLIRPTITYLRVISVVLRFADPESKGLTRFARHAVREETGIVQTSWGSLKYRLYVPVNVDCYGGIVLVHGIHREGIAEPRLINFSRALAAAGVEVMTPEITDLTHYRVTTQTSEMIGYSAEFLSSRMNRPKVGVIGLSFSGGLVLIAAAQPQYAEKIGFVLAVGAHSDLGRVSRFLATDVVQMPDGSTHKIKAHQYGALVIAYSHIEDFFSEMDANSAREALGFQLAEMPDKASEVTQSLSRYGKERFEELLYHRERLQALLLCSIQLHEREMAAASPHDQLQNLNVPVYLLHAARDDIIPPSESLWLSREIPKKQLRAVLISPAIIHADVGEEASLIEKWELATFLSRILEDTDRLSD